MRGFWGEGDGELGTCRFGRGPPPALGERVRSEQDFILPHGSIYWKEPTSQWESEGQGAWGQEWGHIPAESPLASPVHSLLALGSLFPSSKGLILGICPRALSTARPLRQLHVAVGKVVVDINSCPGPQPDIVVGGGYSPHYEGWWDFTWPSPEKAPTIRRHPFLSCQASVLTAG